MKITTISRVLGVSLFFCLFAAFPVLMTSCMKQETSQEKQSRIEAGRGASKTISERIQRNIQVIEYEGCEYIWSSYTESAYEDTHIYSGLAHKGNCKNPIHRGSYNQEIK